MSRRYEFAMQKYGKKRKNKNRFEFPPVPVFKEARESEYEAIWRNDIFSPEDMGEKENEREEYAVKEDLPLAMHAVVIGDQRRANYIGQEFSGITDRISKLLNEYESMYDDKDKQGYAAMQEQVKGQMAMESLLTDYKTLCREREELLYSLQDSLDGDEEEMLTEMENLKRKEHQAVDIEGTEQAIQQTFQNVRDATAKLKMINSMMLALSKRGEATEDLELEKKTLEKEVNMYKKMAVQQRKDIFSRRSSLRRDETQQWKLVAGEMVAMLKMVRKEGNLDKESLEKELNRILMTLNTQTEYIENLKRDLKKHERNVKNLEKDKARLNNDKLMVEDELQTKENELKQCKQYLRKVMTEQKSLGDKVTAGVEQHEGSDEAKPGEEMTTTDILQAQVRDVRKLLFKFEEENKELQKKIASLKEKQSKAEPSTDSKVEIVKECPNCPSYEAQLLNSAEELKKKDENIERLKEEMNKVRAQLMKSKKEILYVKSELQLVEAEMQEERLKSDARSAITISVESAAASPQGSSEHEPEESGKEEVKEKPKEASRLTVSTKQPKQSVVKTPQSPRNRTEVVKEKKEEGIKQEEEVVELVTEEEEEDDDEEEEVEIVERRGKVKTLTPMKKEKRRERFKLRTRDLVLGDRECREEKAPYVTVREARMVTLADKGTQTSLYDRKAMTQRQPQGRRRSLAETIMAGMSPSMVEQETNVAMMFIREEADRLCDDISGFVEYGYDLVQQGAKTTRLLTETHLGEDASKMLESEQLSQQEDMDQAIKALMSSDHRRQSITASKKRRPSLHLERRGTIRRDSKLPLLDASEGLLGRKREDSISEEVEADGDEQGPPRTRVNSLFDEQTDTSRRMSEEVFDSSFVAKSKWSTLRNFVYSLRPHKGGGCSHIVSEVKHIAEDSGEIPSEDQVKEQVKVMAQHAIDTIQSTAQILSHQLQAELTLYEKFYRMWSDVRQKKQPSLHLQLQEQEGNDEIPIVGKKLLTTIEERVAPEFSLLVNRETDVVNTQESALFPLITPQVSSFQTGGRGVPIATAGLPRGGMMIIQGAAPKSTAAISPSKSQSKMKKRGKVKSYSRKQILLKQKAVMDKMLHVDAKIADLQNIFSGMELERQKSQNATQHSKQSQGIPPATSQDFYFPFTAHSLALPNIAQGLQLHGAFDYHSLKQEIDKKLEIPKEPSTGEDEHDKEFLQLPGMNNAVWQRRSSIAKYPTQKTQRKSISENQTKLPLLTINHILKVGQ